MDWSREVVNEASVVTGVAVGGSSEAGGSHGAKGSRGAGGSSRMERSTGVADTVVEGTSVVGGSSEVVHCHWCILALCFAWLSLLVVHLSPHSPHLHLAPFQSSSLLHSQIQFSVLQPHSGTHQTT